MEHSNLLSWTWSAKIWRHLRAVTMNNYRCLRSAVYMHIYSILPRSMYPYGINSPKWVNIGWCYVFLVVALGPWLDQCWLIITFVFRHLPNIVFTKCQNHILYHVCEGRIVRAIALIRRSGFRVPIRSIHFLPQKNWHFHKNTRSCVENECCCLPKISISNVNFTLKKYYLLNLTHKQPEMHWCVFNNWPTFLLDQFHTKTMYYEYHYKIKSIPENIITQ